jgi:hypothetical protein
VHTDASNFALGVMLGQNPYNIIDRPIYYATTNNALNNYITTKKKNPTNDICCEEI